MRLQYVIGMICGFAVTHDASAQNRQLVPPSPQAQMNRDVYPPAIYQRNDVSTSLNLNQQQIDNLNKLSEQTRAQYQESYNSLRTLNDSERFAREQELNRKYYGDWNMGARNVFNENQWNRYQQLNYQHDGFNAFYEPNIQKRLNLTADQKKTLDEQRIWSEQQLREINRSGAIDATKGAQMYRDYWKEREERFNKFLTPEQRTAWAEIIGERYEFQPGFGFYSGSNSATTTSAQANYFDVVPAKSRQALASPSAASVSPNDGKGHISVMLPDPNAVLIFNGRPTTSIGSVRYFQSPELSTGNYTYSYEVEASWKANGKLVTKTYTVKVGPGAQSLVDFVGADQ